MTDKRLPSDIPWPEMEDYLETAHALVMAWAIDDGASVEKVLDNFVQDYLDNGQGRLFIYMLVYIITSTLQTVCDVGDMDMIDMLVMTNKARMSTFPG